MKFKFFLLLYFILISLVFPSEQTDTIPEKNKNSFNVDVAISGNLFKRLNDSPFEYLKNENNDSLFVGEDIFGIHFMSENIRNEDLQGATGILNFNWSKHLFSIQTNNYIYYPEITWFKEKDYKRLFMRHDFLEILFSEKMSNYYPGLVYENQTELSYRDIYLGFDIEVDTSEKVLFIPYTTGYVNGILFRKSNAKEIGSNTKSTNNSIMRNEFHLKWKHLNPKFEYFSEIPSYFDNMSLCYGITNFLAINYNIDYWKRDGIFPHRLSKIKLKYAFGKDNELRASSAFYDTRSQLEFRNPFYHNFKEAFYSVEYSKNNYTGIYDSSYHRELNTHEYYIDGTYGFSNGEEGFKNLIRAKFGYGIKQGISINLTGYYEQLPSNTVRGLLNLSCIYNKNPKSRSNDKGNLKMILSYYPFVYHKYETQTYHLLGEPYYYYSKLFDGIGGLPYTIPKTVDVLYWNLDFYIEKTFNKVHKLSFNLRSANTPVMNTSQIREGVAAKIMVRRILSKFVTLDFFISGLYSRGVEGTILNQYGDEYYFNNTLMPFTSTEELNIAGGVHASFSF